MSNRVLKLQEAYHARLLHEDLGHMISEEQCTCGLSLNFFNCCAEILSGAQIALSPEKLMRARYSAFKLGLVHFLNETDHINWQHDIEDEKVWVQFARQELSVRTWISLTVIDSGVDPMADKGCRKGWVHFKAIYKEQGSLGVLEERSEFDEVGVVGWTYTRGEAKWTPLKLGRNDMCVCGSGRKWKKCCGRRKY